MNFLSTCVLNKGNLAHVHSGNTNIRRDGAIIVKYFTSPWNFRRIPFRTACRARWSGRTTWTIPSGKGISFIRNGGTCMVEYDDSPVRRGWTNYFISLVTRVVVLGKWVLRTKSRSGHRDQNAMRLKEKISRSNRKLILQISNMQDLMRYAIACK